MFTTRTERDPSYIIPPSATKSLGPGSYAVGKSSLKLSSYRGLAPFNSRAKPTTFLDAEIKRSQQYPSVGQYAPSTLYNYIRGNRQTSSCFCSATARFYQEKHTSPGPCEYFKEEQIIERNQTRPAVYTTLKDQMTTIASIPYERKQKQKMPILSDYRAGWIVEAASEQLQNPGPGDVLQLRRKEFVYDAVYIPVGGASTSLAHVDGYNAWARAPERMKDRQTLEEQYMGPGKYQLGTSLQIKVELDAEGRVKNSAAFKTVADRHSFVPDKSLTQGPGTYYTEAYNSIYQRQFIQRYQIDLKNQQKQHIRKIEELNAKLLPSVAGHQSAPESRSNERNYYTAIERAMMETPAVGTYTKELTSQSTYVDLNYPKLSENAMGKMALQQTFNALKWPETACSIPAVVITDQDDVQAEQNISRAPEAKLKMPSWNKYLDRNLEKLEMAYTGDLGPGDYEIRGNMQQKSFSIKPSHAFSSTYQRDDLYSSAKAKELQEHITQQQESTYYQQQQYERQVGGVETALNFTKAKYSGANNNLQFGSTIERGELHTLLADRDLSVPGAGEYDFYPKSSKIPMSLNRDEREIGYQQQYGKIPASLKPEIAGPGAEKAAAILIERKLNETNIGPGNYYKLASSIAKKSFNSKAEDNIVQ